MLLEIAITNIALIERLRLELGPGLNVLTGETGAGKSIVVDALSLALGGRSDRELIRTGQDKARVDALFDISANPEALTILTDAGLDADDNLLVVSRELTATGRSVCRVAGSVVPLSTLKQLTTTLVDMHGQHEHQQLADPARHLHYLDAYGDAAHSALLDDVRARYETHAALKREARALTMDAAERERRRDMLLFQLGEIDAVAPKPGEEEKLKQKNELNKNAERIADGVGKAYELVYKGAGRGHSAQELLKRAAEAVQPIAHLDARFESIAARLNELFYTAEDVGYELADLVGALEFVPADADSIAERLSEIKRLTRKYGPEVSDVLAFRERAAAELAQLEGGDERLREITAQLNTLEQALHAACVKLTDSRKALAAVFAARVLRELGDLGMGRARFEVKFTPREYTALGADGVEFMLSANPGEPVKPLSQVASGGELSRIMLAMKAVAADTAGVDAMVFDEIDTGVSGRMAQVVGEKMAAIARKRQVICVTHLPQIAALADRQYLAKKTSDGERTHSSVELLNRDGRIEELARLVGGAGDAASGRAHAEHLLDAAQALLGTRPSPPP